MKKANTVQKAARILAPIKTVDLKLEIDMRDGRYTNDICILITMLLSNNQKVQQVVLWLPANYIDDDGVIFMFEELQHLVELRKLTINLEWNFDISNRTVESICRLLDHLPNLEYLSLRIKKNTYVNKAGDQQLIDKVKHIRTLSNFIYDGVSINHPYKGFK